MSTGSLSAVLFLLMLLRNLIQLHKSNASGAAAQLLSRRSGNPRSSGCWLWSGAATLAAGYVMAITIQSPLQALTRFFFAVVLVIIGTYCLFTAGSIAVLKLLPKPTSITTISPSTLPPSPACSTG